MESKVTIIIPTHNQAEFLKQAITSVLAQTYTNYEILIINDGSTDETIDVIEQFMDPRINSIHLQENVGPAAARNVGLQLATGEFIAFLDSDDLWFPNRLFHTVSFLNKHPDIDIVCGAWDYIDETGKTIASFSRPSKYNLQKETDFLRTLIVHGNILATSALLFRRCCFDKCGLFDERLKRSMDWDLWLRMIENGCKIALLDIPVSRYRHHNKNITLDTSLMEEAAEIILEKRFSNENLVARLAGLREHAYIDAWLRIAELSYRASKIQETKVLISKAENLFLNAPLNPALHSRYLQLVYGLPDTNTFISLITSTSTEALTIYQWLQIKQMIRSGQYLQGIVKLIAFISGHPVWLSKKIMQKIQYWAKQNILVRR